MNLTLERESPFVCDLTALDAAQRRRYAAVLAQLRQSVEMVVELPNGLAFRHPADPATLLAIAEFISLERRCCPFLNFDLEVVIADGPAWLRLTGPEGVKAFLRAELGLEGV